jgi:hypothetical protein
MVVVVGCSLNKGVLKSVRWIDREDNLEQGEGLVGGEVFKDVSSSHGEEWLE